MMLLSLFAGVTGTFLVEVRDFLLFKHQVRGGGTEWAPLSAPPTTEEETSDVSRRRVSLYLKKKYALILTETFLENLILTWKQYIPLLLRRRAAVRLKAASGVSEKESLIKNTYVHFCPLMITFSARQKSRAAFVLTGNIPRFYSKPAETAQRRKMKCFKGGRKKIKSIWAHDSPH